jgi:hypothetical protein
MKIKAKIDNPDDRNGHVYESLEDIQLKVVATGRLPKDVGAGHGPLLYIDLHDAHHDDVKFRGEEPITIWIKDNAKNREDLKAIKVGDIIDLEQA